MHPYILFHGHGRNRSKPQELLTKIYLYIADFVVSNLVTTLSSHTFIIIQLTEKNDAAGHRWINAGFDCKWLQQTRFFQLTFQRILFNNVLLWF